MAKAGNGLLGTAGDDDYGNLDILRPAEGVECLGQAT